MNRSACLLLLALPACADTGTEAADVPLYVQGTEARLVSAGDWEVELTSAELAFGPLYLCPGNTAGDLCDTALLEWLDAARVDLLDPDARPVGALEGSTGTARSWMYDLGITSVLTDPDPVPLAAAEALDGNSVVLTGVAVRDGTTVRFRAAIPLEQGSETEQGVPLVRKSTNEAFEHRVEGGEALRVRFDPHPWVETVDFGSLAQPRVDSQGPSPELTLQPDTQPYRAVRNAVGSGARPTFTWTAQQPHEY